MKHKKEDTEHKDEQYSKKPFKFLKNRLFSPLLRAIIMRLMAGFVIPIADRCVEGSPIPPLFA